MLKTRTSNALGNGSFGKARKAMLEGLAILAISGAGCATAESRGSGTLDSLTAEVQRESHVIVSRAEDGKVGASVLVFEEGTAGSQASREFVSRLEGDCGRSEPDAVYGCMCGRSLERFPELDMRTLRGAVVSFEYFEPPAEGRPGTWAAVPGCESVVADRASVDSELLSSVAAENIPHYAVCDVSAISAGGRVMIRATFLPREGEGVSASSAIFEFTQR